MTLTRLRAPLAMLAALALLMLGAVVGVPGAVAQPGAMAVPTGNGQQVCPEGNDNDSGGVWRKIDSDEIGDHATSTDGDGEALQVEVDALAGQYIVQFCVKAGQTVEIVDVDPGVTTLSIDAPDDESGKVHAISHVSVREVPYLAPTCEGLEHPDGGLSAGEHVNIEVQNLLDGTTQKFNFHADSDEEYAGVTHFDPTDHPDWPGWTDYAIVWIQVNALNYHWKGFVECGELPAEVSPVVEVTQAQCEAQPGVVLGQTIVSTAGIAVHGAVGAEVVVKDAAGEVVVGDDLLDLDAGAYTVTVTLGADQEFGELGDGWTAEGGVATFTAVIDELEDCWELVVVEPAVSVTDVCGLTDDTVTGVPTVGVSYSVPELETPETWTIVATAVEGYVFDDEKTTRTFTGTFEDQQCPEPSPSPSVEPSPSPSPSEDPTPEPSPSPSDEPTEEPSPEPSEDPTPTPTPSPSDEPSLEPSPSPSPSEDPTPGPSPSPSDEPTEEPSPEPSEDPTPTPTETPEPTKASLDGSVAVGECVADAPWIAYEIELEDPDGQAVPDENGQYPAYLVLTDGTNEATISLGVLGEDGTLSGRALWPGASVADDGVTATGWPGWTQDAEGRWVETDENYAWTRGDVDATLVVNPDIAVALDYPDATPECANPPAEPEPGQGGVDPIVDDEPTPAAQPTSPALPQTGSDVALFAIGALLLIGAGGAFLWLRRRA
ncbi:hypothetical protein GCM10023216_01870 [Isoptericola chiayiensis]|uniref:Gram-positive cocci surface proteins LPxTG domain-containing protein n=1 Tax=Isoptericola chiayiensis TaxID=579446 RepID=A0ABP8XYS3_9MICO|nr:LPXTG cell wall anchor domain-containing protein [Isoptericola chiayiensis]NOW01251.1 LPXTG-motif cell wall-anchored protein [Isoptericola chiayiensis]